MTVSSIGFAVKDVNAEFGPALLCFWLKLGQKPSLGASIFIQYSSDILSLPRPTDPLRTGTGPFDRYFVARDRCLDADAVILYRIHDGG